MGLIDTNTLLQTLRIGCTCETCERNDAGRCKGHLSWLCKRIQNAPAVTRGEWIPCTERQPKARGEYMVTISHGKNLIINSARYTKARGWWVTIGRVIAWREMPEPYRA